MKAKYDPQVTLRMSPAITAAARRLMVKRGVTNLSDFIRQSVVAEIQRLENEEETQALARAHLAHARQLFEAQILAGKISQPLAAEEQAPYGDASAALVPFKPKR